MNRGRLLSVSQGNFIASIPPYGYNKIWVTEGKKKCPTLSENKEQADVVRLIFDLYVNKDLGYKRICNHLENLNIRPPKGEHWSPSALKDMLRNVHYIGKVKWNWRKTITTVEDSEIVKTRPKARIGEYLIYDGKHEGIVSEEIFNLAEEKFGRNDRVPFEKKMINALSGVIFCQCGRAMSFRTSKAKDGSERNQPRLMCNNQTHCKTGSCLYDEMIDRVVAILEKCIEDFEINMNNDTGDSIKLHNQLIKNLEKKLKDIEAKEIAQWEAQADPNPDVRMPANIFKLLNEKLLKEKEDIQDALRKAIESAPAPIDYEERIVRFKDALHALKDPDVEIEKKNSLLKACIERIDYYRETPVRLKHKKGEPLPIGGDWSKPPIKIDVKLKV